eukprot:scaffold4521_cov388-Prasinococcus_capsulatus_cf.AAC.7
MFGGVSARADAGATLRPAEEEEEEEARRHGGVSRAARTLQYRPAVPVSRLEPAREDGTCTSGRPTGKGVAHDRPYETPPAVRLRPQLRRASWCSSLRPHARWFRARPICSCKPDAVASLHSSPRKPPPRPECATAQLVRYPSVASYMRPAASKGLCSRARSIHLTSMITRCPSPLTSSTDTRSVSRPVCKSVNEAANRSATSGTRGKR